ncbi:MAG: helix-turn-helix domain-containing protein [Prevotella sp.]|jgi:AraC-like DNA-binding protein
MNRHRIILLVLCFAFLPLLVWSASQKDSYFYHRWENLPSEKLMEMGQGYCSENRKPDSALVCFTIVANRTHRDMTQKEAENAIGANNGKWFVYFFEFFDYNKSFESLQQAARLCDEYGYSKARVYLNFGCMYQTMAEQTKVAELYQKAMHYYKLSFDEAIKTKKEDVAFNTMSNRLIIAGSLNTLPQLKNDMEILKQTFPHPSNDVGRFVFLQFDALNSLASGNTQKALRILDQMHELKQLTGVNIRYKYMIYIYQSTAYRMEHDYNKALNSLRQAERLAEQYDMKDTKMESYQLHADLCRQIGQKATAEIYTNRYLHLKDTLLNYRQLASVNRLQFLDKMNEIQLKMDHMKQRNRMRNIIFWCVLVVAIVVCGFLIVISRNNKRLRQTNRRLYLNIQQSLEAAEKERKQHQQEASALNEPNEEKYKSSRLDEDTKAQLAKRIQQVMENSEEIYSMDFSADRLAELVGSKYKYVSQVINETYHCNFNALLNKYRVEEACKRLSDVEHYGNYTIEVVANSVGFKSVNGFRNIFRSATGLTPSEYLRLARQESKA